MHTLRLTVTEFALISRGAVKSRQMGLLACVCGRQCLMTRGPTSQGGTLAPLSACGLLYLRKQTLVMTNATRLRAKKQTFPLEPVFMLAGKDVANWAWFPFVNHPIVTRIPRCRYLHPAKPTRILDTTSCRITSPDAAARRSGSPLVQRAFALARMRQRAL